MVANHKIADQLIQNIKSNPNKVYDLTGEMKKSLKNRDWKQVSNHKYTKSHASLTIMVKQITVEGHMPKNEVVLEPGWICENFVFSEPAFYKQVTTVTCDETQHKNYSVPVGRYALHTSVYEPNFVNMHHNALICIVKSNKK